jgi:hypothetical protein
MDSVFIYSFVIGFVGAALFLLVDEYERGGMIGNLLKFLVLAVRGSSNSAQIRAVRHCVVLAPRRRWRSVQLLPLNLAEILSDRVFSARDIRPRFEANPLLAGSLVRMH